MPKCTINGKEIEVKDGTSVIEAFKQTGEDICHYCWHPALSVAGVCRLCMVEIEGMPKLQIGCNTKVQDGMVITNQSEQVKDAVKWGLDFHLVNHPLDCPICDQAGECGLQDQYMQFGKYDPEMAERKVKKRKAVSLGDRVILDSERCILCSRCVRFTSEVSKTNELGIFNRGDRSEIGTFHDKPLNNNYSLNTVDICPVGALTSKDFRFRQRVWYLKDAETVCPGCSTGCNVKTYFNEEGLFRVKPIENSEVNGYWMCDTGRDTYKYVNKEFRLQKAKSGSANQWQSLEAGAAAIEAGKALRDLVDKQGAGSVALVLTGQYTSEEYETALDFFVEQLGSKQIYHWQNNPDKMNDFDGLLYRGDRNPNTAGLKSALSSKGVNTSWSDLESKISAGSVKAVVVAGPEDQSVFPTFKEKAQLLSKADQLVWLTAGHSEALDQSPAKTWQIPVKTYIEKDGTFVNFEGRAQSLRRATTIVAGALTLSEAVILMAGGELSLDSRPRVESHLKKNFFVQQRGSL